MKMKADEENIDEKKLFKDLIKDDTEDTSVLKELFNKKDIGIKTEIIGLDEAAEFSLYYWLATHKAFKETKLKSLLDKQLELRLSLNRKSRLEFIEGFKHGDVGKEPVKRGFFERLGF